MRVIKLKENNLMNQNVASIAEVTSFLIMNTAASAEVNTEIMMKLMDAEQRITELEGKING